MASQYPKNVVTKKGLALISECIATNKQLVFTRVIVGDGELTSNQDVSAMLNAISPKMELPITKAQNEGNGQFLVRATISNSKLDIGFFPKEVALFAKAEGGTEILYAYTNGGDKVGFVPDKSIPIESEIYNIRTIIGAVTNVKAIIKDETFVTVLDLREAFTDDTSSVDDADIESNSLLADLGARVSYVKKYVKKAISDAFKSDDFDDNVIRAIGKKTFEGLGVQARFSNANSWFICFGPLFFGLIIQGGATGRPANNAATANFAIAFNNTDYIIIPVGVIDASDSKFSLTVNVLKDYKTANSCTFRTSDAIAPACYYVAFSRAN
nr:MAG TPA: tail-collar fiber protein [Caudoviricetes sp.]